MLTFLPCQSKYKPVTGFKKQYYVSALLLCITILINFSAQANTTVLPAPVITTNPSNAAACSGLGTSFTVVASNSPTSYQWYLSTNGGTSYTPVSNGGVYSGATTATLSISNVAGLTGNLYQATATNITGTSSPSTGASLTVNTAPSVTVNPTNNAICAGATTTTFTVTATGTGLGYQWKVSTDGGTVYNNVTNTGIYTGATTATLTLTQATYAYNSYMYMCVVSGTCTPGANSSAATLTVTPPPVITAVSPLKADPSTAITITGTNFNTTASNNILFFGSTKATVNTASATSLGVSVPAGATYDRITITNLGCKLAASAQYSFLPTFTGSITTPAFASATTTTAGTNPFDMIAADFDGDGKPDVAVTNGQGGSWSVFRNTSTSGSITYASEQNFRVGPSGQSIYGLAVGDLNRDGKPDVVVADRDSSKINVYINTSTSGSISFGNLSSSTTVPATTFAKYVVTHPWQVKIADLDADGRPEIIVAGDDQQKFSYFRNIYNGSSAFNATSFATKVDVSVPSSQFLDALAIGDIDGDGKPDVIAGAQTTNVNNLQVFRNTSSAPGSISFASAVTSSSAQYIWYLAVGDLDGDGKADIVAGNNGASYLTVLPNSSTSGSITFGTPLLLASNGGGYGVTLADFTGHGKPDIAYVNSDGGSMNTVSIYRNTSSSGTISFSPKNDFASASSQSWAVVSVDMNGDGKPDMVVPNYQGTGFASYVNTIPGSVLPLTLLSFNASPSGNAVKTSWTTTDEKNTATFELERSADGITFKPLAQLPAKDNAGNNSYGWTDNNPYSGANFYRLKMIDQNGSFTYSQVVSVIFNAKVAAIEIYPNPGNIKAFKLKMMYAENGKYTMRLYNLSGMLLYETTITNTGTQLEQSLALPASIPPGTYTISLKKGQTVLSQKIIIQ